MGVQLPLPAPLVSVATLHTADESSHKPTFRCAWAAGSARKPASALNFLSLRSTPLENIAGLQIDLRLLRAARRASRAHGHPYVTYLAGGLFLFLC